MHSPYWVGFIIYSASLLAGYGLPPKGQTPVKDATAECVCSGYWPGELQVVLVYDCYVRTDHSCGVLCNSCQERLQPAVETLTSWVKNRVAHISYKYPWSTE